MYKFEQMISFFLSHHCKETAFVILRNEKRKLWMRMVQPLLFYVSPSPVPSINTLGIWCTIINNTATFLQNLQTNTPPFYIPPHIFSSTCILLWFLCLLTCHVILHTCLTGLTLHSYMTVISLLVSLITEVKMKWKVSVCLADQEQRGKWMLTNQNLCLESILHDFVLWCLVRLNSCFNIGFL